MDWLEKTRYITDAVHWDGTNLQEVGDLMRRADSFVPPQSLTDSVGSSGEAQIAYYNPDQSADSYIQVLVDYTAYLEDIFSGLPGSQVRETVAASMQTDLFVFKFYPAN